MAVAPKTETPKPEKTKAEKFSELATARLNKAVDAVELLANLASKANYDYTPEQVAAINTHLTAAVKFVADAFASGGVKKSVGVKL